MFIFLIIFAVTIFYFYIRHIYSYWSRNGIQHIEPTIPAGNLSRLASGKVSFGVAIHELYKQTIKQPFVGIYLFFRPAILVRDAGLAKRMLTSDFKHFHDRGVYCSAHDELSQHLFATSGQKWRNLRAKLTPTFTSGKLKTMLPIIMTEGDKLDKYMQKFANQSAKIEMKEIASRFTLNVIASTIFGLEVDTINNPNDSFFEIDKIITNNSVINKIRAAGVFLCPKLLEYFHISAASQEVRDYMINIVKTQIDFREKNNVARKDFIQSLIELRKSGKVSEDSVASNIETAVDEFKSMTIEQCAAQVFLMYAAGFDTSASAITFSLFELSRRPDIMKKLQNEIDETLIKHNGELTYDCIQDMTYLDLCFKETIRKYPGLPILNRECTEDYQIPDTPTIIKKGTGIIISILGFARDEQYFPEPELYRPERFSDPVPQFNEDAYLPFGEGPRACIAIRMGKLVAKVGLIKLLKKYNFEAIDSNELEFANHAITLLIKGGVNLKVTNRSS